MKMISMLVAALLLPIGAMAGGHHREGTHRSGEGIHRGGERHEGEGRGGDHFRSGNRFFEHGRFCRHTGRFFGGFEIVIFEDSDQCWYWDGYRYVLLVNCPDLD